MAATRIHRARAKAIRVMRASVALAWRYRVVSALVIAVLIYGVQIIALTIPTANAAYTIANSVRFISGNSAYLTHTPGVAGNRRTFTVSFWVKKVSASDTTQIFGQGAGIAGGSSGAALYWDGTNGTLRFYSGSADYLITSGYFRDPAAWLHVVLKVDTTQATAADRMRLYINGVEQALSTASYPAQNTDLLINQAVEHRISGNTSGTYKLNDYLADFYFIDGAAVDPTCFGQYDANGYWRPKTYTTSAPCAPYGTNGFHLDFSNGAALGTDTSGNGNTFTASGLAATDQMIDSPTNGFATMNPLKSESGMTLTSGNLALSGSVAQPNTTNTVAIPASGKWYFEATNGSANNSNVAFGVGLWVTGVTTGPGYLGSTAYWFYSSASGALLRDNGTSAATGLAAAGTGETFQVAVDSTNGKMWIGRGNVWYDGSGGTTGNPATGANPTFTPSAIELSNYPLAFIELYADTATANFGQGGLSGLTYDSASGGSFKYTPPSGFKALSTTNLPDPRVTVPKNYFDAFLYTGTGASQTVKRTTIYLMSGSTWQVPADWNNSNNTIEVIGGGGGGGAGGSDGAAGGGGGGGGGGGAYAKISNTTLTPGASVALSVGSGGPAASAGGDTYFCNSGVNCASIAGSAVIVGAKGGGAGANGSGSATGASGSGGSAASGVGSLTYSGGNGSAGANSGRSGGGAAGPHGNGGTGGAGTATTGSGGGGGGGGGSNGADSTTIGGAGGTNYASAGSGTAGAANTAGGAGSAGGGGGGGGYKAGAGGAGGAGTDWDGSHGSGGGGGGGAYHNLSSGGAGGNGGNYGGGGAGGGGSSPGSSAGGAGAQGIIVIQYTPSSSSNITGFTPDLVWLKDRTAANDHALFDSARGATNVFYSNKNSAEVASSTSLTAFTTSGFTLGADGTVNTSAHNYVSWLWKKSPTIDGVDIVTYTGTGVARTIAHSLGAAPDMIVVKRRDTTGDAAVYHSSAYTSPQSVYLLLDSTAATTSDTTMWNNTAPTASVFSVGTNSAVNAAPGYTWTQQTGSGARNWNAITSSSDGTKLAAVENNATGSIYTSTDSGVTWTQRTNAGARNWIGIASSADGTKLVATANNDYIYTSTDSGVTWTQRTGPGIQYWDGVTSSSDGTKLAATVGDLFHAGDIFTSTDSGATWTDRTGAGAKNWGIITSSSDGTKLAAVLVTGAGNVYTSSDSGATWTAQTGSGSRNFKGITSSSDGTKLAASVATGFIYTSTDSGVTWTEQQGAGSQFWNTITSSSDGTKLAVGSAASYMYTSSDSGVTWTQQTSAGTGHNWYALTSSADGSKLAVAVKTASDYIYTGTMGTTTYVAYLFKGVDGFSKFGSYTGNGAADGPFVYTGFKPRFIMIKRADGVGDWWIYDAARDAYNPASHYVYWDSNGAETNDPTGEPIDILSNGFKIRLPTFQPNTSGAIFLYAAFADVPFKYSAAPAATSAIVAAVVFLIGMVF